VWKEIAFLARPGEKKKNNQCSGDREHAGKPLYLTSLAGFEGEEKNSQGVQRRGRVLLDRGKKKRARSSTNLTSRTVEKSEGSRACMAEPRFLNI